MVEGLIQEKMTLQQLWQNKPKKKKTKPSSRGKKYKIIFSD